VQGYKQTDAGGYSPFVDFFAPATMVCYDEGRQQLPINKEGMLTIPKEYLNTILNEKKEEEKEVKPKTKKVKKMSIEIEEQTKMGAGRPKKHAIQLPRNEEFTVGHIAAKLGVKKFVINNEIAKIQRENPNALQVVGTMPQAKGKPARVFKLS
jgi:ABC-type Fe3+-citrate transport system substrate-binding protein